MTVVLRARSGGDALVRARPERRAPVLGQTSAGAHLSQTPITPPFAGASILATERAVLVLDEERQRPDPLRAHDWN